ncbi:MAG TPA: hypothetical protein VLF71_04525 [Candidatus Saccharimonadales bacterium]|nr:hypothetical protein [Candidatus Saccharimonadales bacterium]
MAEVPRLARLAIAASARHDSYRGVGVGALLVAENRRTGRIARFAAANIKPIRGEAPLKRCAEMWALAAAREAGFPLVRGIVVAGPSDPTIVRSITDILTPTLHPCDACLGRMDFYDLEGRLAVPGTTPIVTVGKEDGHYQVHTRAELEALHGLREPTPDTTIDAPVFYRDLGALPRAVEAALKVPGHPVAALRIGLELLGASVEHVPYPAAA